MSKFDIIDTSLEGLKVLKRKPMGDSRGYLERLFCEQDLSACLGGRRIRQINRSFSATPGTLRGMHFQNPPSAEMKILTCLHGEVADVVVDIRPDSPTFGEWHLQRLGTELGVSLLVPEGFAHGFQTLTDDCEMLYFHTAAYDGAAEGGIDPLDPALGIAWPLPPGEMSERDRLHPKLSELYP